MTDMSLAALPPGFHASVWASGVAQPRGMALAPNGDVLVVERKGNSKISALWDANGDGVVSESERAVVASSATSLNHGITLHNGYLFASSDTTVFRWPYNGAERSDAGEHTVVVNNINADGQGGAPQGHWTRTLKVTPSGRMFISVGSFANVDDDDYRSRIRYIDGLDSSDVSLPVDFTTAETWARGLRNEVGLAFDSDGVLWGVENGADSLWRADLGGDIHNDNPGEELNRFPAPTPGTDVTYGYPQCFSEFNIPTFGLGKRTQWAWPSFLNNGVTDAWCQDEANVVPPALVMQAHTAPLGLAFFKPSPPYECSPDSSPTPTVAFPCSMVGDVVVSQHGSWNRDVPVGYAVVHLPFKDGMPTGEVIPLLSHAGTGVKWPSNLRPVDSLFLPDGSLLVSSDSSEELIRIIYDASTVPAPPAIPPTAPLRPPTAALTASLMVDGCPAPGAPLQSQCVTPMDASAKAAVRCCHKSVAEQCISVCNLADAGAYGDPVTPRLLPNTSQVSLLEASQECEAHEGFRLCTAQEVEDRLCCSTGCGFDHAMVWTSEECSFPPPSSPPEPPPASPSPSPPSLPQPPSSPPAPPAVSRWALNGCPESGLLAQGQCASQESLLAAVRCCHETERCISVCDPEVAGVWGDPQSPTVLGSTSQVSFTDAQDECAAREGFRLCTRQELEDNGCCATGCGFDHVLVWTSDACSVPLPSPPPPSPPPPVSRRALDGCPESGPLVQGQCASQESPLAAVRCCHETEGCISVCDPESAGVWGDPQSPLVLGSTSQVSFTDARDECAAREGFRLCTRQELEDNGCCATGCGFDHMLVWASGECED